MNAWIQATLLTFVIGILFFGTPIAGSIVGTMAGIGFGLIFLKEVFALENDYTKEEDT